MPVYLAQLSLFQFKNYDEAHWHFAPGINCLLGLNGAGKTNLLDAIHYLSLTRSFLHSSDPQHVRHGAPQFVVKGEFVNAATHASVAVSYQAGARKVVHENGIEYKKFSEHLGKYPVVLVAPQDVELIESGAEARRAFFDSLLSQMNKPYLAQLIRYNHFLKQRNGALRLFQERSTVDGDLLARYDAELMEAGKFLAQARAAFLQSLLPLLQKHYRHLTEHAPEQAAIEYETLPATDYADMLRQSVAKDVVLGRTTVGVHRDEFHFLLDGRPLKRFGSQGQQKSFLIALKWAEFDSLSLHLGKKPILLLDDIFDKLDDKRIGHLMKGVAEGHFGQLFITDARPERTRQLMQLGNLTAHVITIGPAE
ncbi:MAG: DNA replication and repair protein RecF [Cyclobacteriaceae bacterium]|nr:DNA replication and repair protein RecF [Cyclobacteriaceae bacterium]